MQYDWQQLTSTCYCFCDFLVNINSWSVVASGTDKLYHVFKNQVSHAAKQNSPSRACSKWDKWTKEMGNNVAVLNCKLLRSVNWHSFNMWTAHVYWKHSYVRNESGAAWIVLDMILNYLCFYILFLKYIFKSNNISSIITTACNNHAQWRLWEADDVKNFIPASAPASAALSMSSSMIFAAP